MSSVNVGRMIDNMAPRTNIHTPLIELIVNAIQAIREKNEDNGLIEIEVIRNEIPDMLDSMADIDGFIVHDNGIGFNKKNRNSFDTLYTDHKLNSGGKGYGRFTCLKYFNNVEISSTFEENGNIKKRSFKMGLGTDIICDENVEQSALASTGSSIKISGVKNTKIPDKNLDEIAHVIVERLLPYFMDANSTCPKIIIREVGDRSTDLSINDYINNDGSKISEITNEENTFSLSKNEDESVFNVRIFKFFSPKNAVSRVTLVAHHREVKSTPLKIYIPEFADEFFEQVEKDGSTTERNFVIKAYVFSDYLNDNVSLERGNFTLPEKKDTLFEISQEEIEEKAADITQAVFGAEIKMRKDRKKERVTRYVEEKAPWHRLLLQEMDISSLSMNPSEPLIEEHFQKEKYKIEKKTREQVSLILESNNINEMNDKVGDVIKSISDSSKNDLIHYVSMRKCALDLFLKSLETDSEGKYKHEGDVHNIIMQRKTTSDDLNYDQHNLWILDERLNFSKFIHSDQPLDQKNGDRPDIIFYNKNMAFRGENTASSPIIIFEFKRPGRDDFVNPSSEDDPVNQITRYVRDLRKGQYKTPHGREIEVGETTLFYSYIVCDLNNKVRDVLHNQHDFTATPDNLGFFAWRKNINLYIEVISWKKMQRDAEMRNRIFFQKLGI